MVVLKRVPPTTRSCIDEQIFIVYCTGFYSTGLPDHSIYLKQESLFVNMIIFAVDLASYT